MRYMSLVEGDVFGVEVRYYRWVKGLVDLQFFGHGGK